MRTHRIENLAELEALLIVKQVVRKEHRIALQEIVNELYLMPLPFTEIVKSLLPMIYVLPCYYGCSYLVKIGYGDDQIFPILKALCFATFIILTLKFLISLITEGLDRSTNDSAQALIEKGQFNCR